MGYQVRKYKGGKWGLLYVLDRGKEGVISRVIYPGTPEYEETGLKPEMGLEEAQRAIRTHRSIKEMVRHGQRRNRIALRLLEEKRVVGAFLPKDMEEEFEREVVGRKYIKTAHWNAARRAILAVPVHPSDWAEEAHRFYNYFIGKGYSLDYVKKVLRVVNEWGRFYTRRLKAVWEKVPAASGPWRLRILRAYRKKQAANGTPVQYVRLRPEDIKGKRHQLDAREFAWLWVTLWFGLRPSETDERKWSIEGEGEKAVLVVRQTKVEDREKRIPIMYDEQRQAVQLMKGPLMRPTRKRMKRIFGKDVILYSCRKGFVNLMDERGHQAFAISAWLGHTSINMTMQYYWDITKVVRG